MALWLLSILRVLSVILLLCRSTICASLRAVLAMCRARLLTGSVVSPTLWTKAAWCRAVGARRRVRCRWRSTVVGPAGRTAARVTVWV